MTTDPGRPILRRTFLSGAAVAGLAAGTVQADPAGTGAARPLHPGTFHVHDFGAQGGRTGNEAAAFQSAIDACHAAGGGTVYVPPGEYLCGPLHLRSRVALYLEAGATVYASTRREDYPERGGRHLIQARDAEYVSILGPGVLHGQGTGDLGRRPGTAYEPRPDFRTGVICMEGCRNILLRDFTILYSDAWACDLEKCEKAVIDGITILNNYFRTNSDGIDPVSCRDVRIANCHITAGDDCICLKTVDGQPCEDVVVTNCTLESVATAIKLGTQSDGDFRRITVDNCTVRNSTVGVGFFVKDGGTIEGVTVSNLAIETLRNPLQVNAERLRNMVYPIYIDVERRQNDSPLGAVRDVLFSNVHIASDNGILIQGTAQSPVENLALHNVVFRVTRPFDYRDREKHAGGTSNPEDDRITRFARQPTYCAIAHARNVVVDNLQVHAPAVVLAQLPRTALSLFDTSGATLRSLHRTPSDNGGPVVALHNVREAFVTACAAPAGTGTFLRLEATPRQEVALEGNDLRRALRPFESDSPELGRANADFYRTVGIFSPAQA